MNMQSIINAKVLEQHIKISYITNLLFKILKLYSSHYCVVKYKSAVIIFLSKIAIKKNMQNNLVSIIIPSYIKYKELLDMNKYIIDYFKQIFYIESYKYLKYYNFLLKDKND